MNREKTRVKICITCSAGGHFAEAMKATEKIAYDKYYVSYYSEPLHAFSENNKVYFITHPRHCTFFLRLVLFMKNIIESFMILAREKPDVIISTGADVALATCIIGKMMKKKLIYIESGGYVVTKSLTGRIVYPLADLFIVQWEPALTNFPKAVYGGPLF